MLRNFAFTAVNVVPQAQVDGRDPQAQTEAPLPNGLNNRPQVINLGVNENIDTEPKPLGQPPKMKMPMWVWYVAAAVIAYLVFKK